MQERAFYKVIQEDLAKVEENLLNFTSEQGLIGKAIGHLIVRGRGKRLRPTLTLLSGRLQHSISGSYQLDIDGLLALATAVELLHSASLLHDDVIDRATKRRGIATISSIWGSAVAILLGDYCYTQSSRLALESDSLEVMSVFAQTSAKMCKGEIINQELHFFEGQTDLAQTKRDYYAVIEDTTASLVSASCQLGSIVTEGSDEEIQRFKRFGLYLGRSFQIVDDILDFIGDEKQLQKPTGNDLRNGKITLPTIFALETLTQENILWEIVQQKDCSQKLIQEGIKIVKNSGGIEQAYSEAYKWKEEAKNTLNLFPDNRYRQALKDLADYIVERNK